MHTSFSLRALASSSLLGFALIFAGSTASRALTNDQIANLTGPDREKILIDGAKKEGELLWYTTLIVDESARPLTDAFQKKYPFVHTKFYRADASTLLQRLLAENQANSTKADIIAFGSNDGVAVWKAGLAAPFTSPVLDEYPPSYVYADHTAAIFRTSSQGIAYNTNIIPKGQGPKTWDDLLDPKWKGMLGWGESVSTGAPALINYFRLIWGDDQALRYVTALKKQDIRIGAESSRAILDQVIAGEVPIGVSITLNHIATSMAAGAPIEGVSPEPVLNVTDTVQLIKKAPHPYAAMLFIDFLLARDDGQTVLRNEHYLPAYPKLEPLPDVRWTDPQLNGRKEIVEDTRKMVEMFPKSEEIYRNLFRQ